ncbi:MAG: xylulokinase [Tepidisphaeraceae bacterium]
MAHLLGIDIGTSGTKTLLCDERGKVLATATAAHTLLTPKPGWSEQHPEEWWQATVRATRDVLKKAKVKGDSVVAIGFSGQMHGSVFLDKSGNVLRPALLWNDQRTQKQCDDITRLAGGREKLIDLVANPALTGFTAPKLLWLRENEPKKYEKLAKLILPKDYVRYRMTGEYAIDAADASGTLLLDVRKRAWSKELISKLKIDASILPEVFESSDVVGTLSREAAAEMGLKQGTKVVAGAGDQAAGAVGNGIVRSGIVNASLGTSGVFFAHSDTPTLDPLGRVHTMCHAVKGKWCVFGCMLSAGGSFQWFRNELAATENELAKRAKKDPYELLIDLAKTAPAGSEGLFFLPYLTGERCPHPDPNARGAWIGLSRRTTRPMLIRALVEGITYGMNDMLTILRGEMKIPVKEVRGTGGGMRSAFWRQLQADVYNAPLVLTNSEEGAAYGAAILAGVGNGTWASVEEACGATIKPVTTIKPNARSASAYAKRQAVYSTLYGQLKSSFAEMATLV